MGPLHSCTMSASEIQSKLVAAIRQIAELEDKIEACDKKSKEIAGEIERRSRQIFYLERNCEQRDKEISEMKTKNFMLEAKANKEDYEAKIEEQECQLERLQSSQETFREKLADVQQQEQAAKDVLTKYQGMIAKACASSNEIISMFQDELSKSAREHVETKAEILKLQSQLVDESSTFDMMKQHVRYLEQYRVDSIFRIFGLKAQLKVLNEKLNDQESVNKLASSIGL